MTKSPRIGKAKGRSVSEWIGAHPDSKAPASVGLRVLRRQDGKCALTGIRIADGQPFDLDHIKRLEDGGENREANLQAVLRLPHEVKSAAERKLAAKADRIAKKGHGLEPAPTRPLQSAPFPPPAKKREPKLPLPPRRAMFEDATS